MLQMAYALNNNPKEFICSLRGLQNSKKWSVCSKDFAYCYNHL